MPFNSLSRRRSTGARIEKHTPPDMYSLFGTLFDNIRGSLPEGVDVSSLSSALGGILDATGGNTILGGNISATRRPAGRGLGQTKLRVQGQRGGPYAGRR